MSEKKEKTEKKDRTSDVDDHISKRYEMKKRLGKGAYGIVWKAMDRKSKEIVAVKKIFDAFRNQTDAQRTFREIMFLQAFRDHPNIIRLRGLHKASNNKDIYLVFDYMDTDLHHVIKKGNVLKDIHRKYIMYQLLRATRYLHSGDVIHRDQKPSNILINAECRIKIADFGLARSLAGYYGEEDTSGPPILTDYVATRWYRAPEILVASKRYTKGVDMWSLGCILGEMLLGKPLFPGSSTVNQIERIMAALPEPGHDEIVNMCSGYGRGLLESTTGHKTTLRDLVKSTSEEAMDLVTKLLVFEPTRRLTATQALAHPYVSKFLNGSEISLDHSIVPPLNDDIQLSVSEYRNKLYELIANSRASKECSPGQGTLSPGVVKQRSPDGRVRKSRVRSDGEVLKENLHKVSKPRVKNYSLEELRDKPAIVNHTMVVRSEPIPKSEVSQKRGSPPHRCSSHSKTDWVKSKSVMASQNKPNTIYNRHRVDKQKGDCGDGSHNFLKQLPSTYLSPTHDKLKQAPPKPARVSALPKVQQKREYYIQNSTSPPAVTSYNQTHGILTSSALQDIRAVLKH